MAYSWVMSTCTNTPSSAAQGATPPTSPPIRPLPPTLVAHGTKNRTVKCELSVECFEHLHTTGYDAELILAKDADHGDSDFGFLR